MPTPAETFLALTSDQKRLVHFALCEQALKKWEAYLAQSGQPRYVESVCGTEQLVDTTLPGQALLCAREGRDIYQLARRYREPIVALQDDDLDFPEPVRFGYYALHNLFMKYALQEPVDDWLIVNQAISTEEDSTRWLGILQAALASATTPDGLTDKGTLQ